MTSLRSSIPYYDHNAEAYARRSLVRLDVDALREFARRLPAGARILDAGCGSGRDLRFFKDRGFEAEGFDGSQRMVEFASRHSSTEVWRADLMMLSLPKSNWDAIWAHRSLIHLPAVGCQRAIASFFAALRPKGLLFVSMEEGEEGEMEEDRTDDPTGPARIIYRFPLNEFESMLRQNGFQTLAQGKSPERPKSVAFIAQRI